MSAEKSASAAPPGAMVTLAGLRQRESERATPEAEPRLTIGGGVETSVHERLNRLREAEIGHHRSRLEHMRQRAEYDQAFARLPGKSRADFNRER